MKSWEIEKMFNKETSSKKRVARGVFNRASRRGYVGSVRTQVDFLKGKEKKAYMNNSEVRVYNMYEDINNVPKVEEIKKMDKFEGCKLLTELKKLHSSASLQRYWGFNNSSSVYQLYYRFGVMEDPKIKRREEKARNKALKKSNSRRNIQKIEAPQIEIPVNKNVFKIEFAGSYSKEDVEQRVLNVCGTMIEGKKYRVQFSLAEEE